MTASLKPEPIDDGSTCKAWRCTKPATWRLWAETRCADHMILTGFLCGPVMRPGTQLSLGLAA